MDSTTETLDSLGFVEFDSTLCDCSTAVI